MSDDDTETDERTSLLPRGGRRSDSFDTNSRTPPSHLENTPSENTRTKPFTWRPLVSILFMSIVQPLCFELIFPFINQMIVENGIVEKPEQVGFYSELIQSMFQFMSFLTTLPCSFISDHLGRKPVVLFGTAGMSISIAMFGVSKTFWMMVATRCIGGTLGGTWSALKVMMAEIYTEKSHRASAFSMFQISFRIGQVTGQPLGGMLSHPARNIAFFDKPFWRKYPFALPCFIASSLAATSVVVACFALNETLPSKRRKTEQNLESNGESSLEVRNQDEFRKKDVSIRSALTPHVISMLVSIFAMAIVSETIFGVYPLFAFTPIASGGLGLSEAQIGTHMAVRAFFNIFLLFFYGPAHRLIGSVRTYQVGMAIWPVTIAFLPALNLLARTDSAGVGTWAFNIVPFIFFMCWSVGGLVWPSSQIVVIEAPPNAETLAMVNGLAQMVQTFTMSIAPAFITTLFAFSLENQILGGNLTYVVMLAIGCAGAVHSLSLKEASQGYDGTSTGQ